jgi:hypothetical protein
LAGSLAGQRLRDHFSDAVRRLCDYRPNTDSFWVDGYFEETTLGVTHDGDPATVKLIGYSQLIRHVGGVARGINIPNAQPDQAGLASVNPDLHLGASSGGSFFEHITYSLRPSSQGASVAHHHA